MCAQPGMICSFCMEDLCKTRLHASKSSTHIDTASALLALPRKRQAPHAAAPALPWQSRLPSQPRQGCQLDSVGVHRRWQGLQP